MKKYFLILLLSIILCGCAANRYYLMDRGKDKKYLAEYIDALASKDKISRQPLIVVDGRPYRYDVELKDMGLPISKNEIAEISFPDQEQAKKTYGDMADGGVLIVTTKYYRSGNHPRPGGNNHRPPRSRR